MKYKVIIVEDDPMVASINKQYVERNSHLVLSEIFNNGKDAFISDSGLKQRLENLYTDDLLRTAV